MSNPGVKPVSAALALAAETHLLGKLGTGSCVVGSHHRIACVQVPFFTVFVRRQTIVGHQMTLERLELLAVLKTDDVVVMDRAFRVYRWLLLVGRRLFGGPAHAPESGMD